MWSDDEAEAILKGATFRLHLGQHRDDRGVMTEFFGTGFFVGTDGFALTANHNFEGCVAGQIFVADYKGKTIELKWIRDQSSENADIGVMQLHANPHGVPIDGLRVAYLDPRSSLAERKDFFRAKGRLSIFGYPVRDKGGVGWRIQGMVDAGLPIIDVFEEGKTTPAERVCIRGARVIELEGISGAAVVDREAGIVIAVEGSYDCHQEKAAPDRTIRVSGKRGGFGGKVIVKQHLSRGSNVVYGSEIAGLVSEQPQLAQHFELIERPKYPPPPPPPSPPVVSPAYREWLQSRCASLELLGLRLRHGQAVKLGNVYVPLTTTSGEREQGQERGQSARVRREIVEFDRQQPSLLLHRLGDSSLYVPGDPGSGKSTFCRWVVWLACEGSMPAADVELPEQLREWLPASLLGRLPLLVPLREFWPQLPTGDRARGFGRRDLEAALGGWVDRRDPDGLTGDETRDHLGRGSVLLVLDGIDEVPPVPRGVLLSALAEAIPVWHHRGHRLLVTSRPYGLAPDQVSRLSLAVAPILPLSEPLQSMLVRRWFRILGDNPSDADRIGNELLRQVSEQKWLSPLTANPLLLTAMCIVFGDGKRLPEDKYELYDRVVDTVLHSRILDRPRLQLVRAALSVVAHEMHTGDTLDPGRETPQPQITDRDIDRTLRAYHERSSWAEREVRSTFEAREELVGETGLLLPRGEHDAAFLHFSFQEFLAAERLGDVEAERIADVFLERSPTPEWRNTLSFVYGSVLATTKSPERAVRLLARLTDRIDSNTVGLQVVVADAVEILAKRGIRPAPAVEERLRQAWLETMRNAAAVPRDRCRLGDVLALLGDPRFQVDAWHLPAEAMLGFLEVPAGRFRMGSDLVRDSEAYRDEQPAHDVELPTFYIARFPVTVAQFEAFVKDSGFEPGNSSCLRGVPNHPVGKVSWHEAFAYCRWLTRKLAEWEGTPEPLKSLLRGGAGRAPWEVTLPSEAEREKAARGRDSRIFPWGDEPDANKANYGDTGIGGTSAVGCFSQGASPYKVEELSGNVWEWTRSLWGKDFRVPRFRYPYESVGTRENLSAPDDVLRVVRGGSFFSSVNLVRAAFREWYDPVNRFDGLGFRVVVSPFTSDL
jgi:formylglycine-generating enzyme required for sulfatase activity